MYQDSLLCIAANLSALTMCVGGKHTSSKGWRQPLAFEVLTGSNSETVLETIEQIQC